MLSEKEFLQSISEHQNIIHKVCNMYADNAHTREDLFQEVLLNAWKGIANFRGEAKFTTWLYRVALNTAITYYRKTLKAPIAVELTPRIAVIGDSSIIPDERLPAMNKAITRLSKVDKALVLLYLEEYNHSEIGELLGISANNVAVKLNRIKSKLKEETTRLMNV